jgi:Predicted transcriptional regulator
LLNTEQGAKTLIRSSHQIISEILQVCRNSTRKTTIVKNAKLDSKRADSYLQVLLKNQLIYANQGEYQITEKGVSLLDRINQVNVQLYGYDI